MHHWKLLAIVIPVCISIDLFWLAVVMKNFYLSELAELARKEGNSLSPRWGPALLVYLLIPIGIVLFVRPLAGEQAGLLRAAGCGALFGLVLYGVYDLTNLAVLDKWTWRVTLVDIAWGCTLCGTVAAIMRLADRWLGG